MTEASKLHRPEKGYDLTVEGEQLVLHVLCGGFALFEVVFALNDEEREEFERRGESYVDTLAKDVQRDPRLYAERSKPQ